MAEAIPLILLPGLLCDQALWDNQIKSLKGLADCTVADTTRQDNVAAIARDVLATAPRQFTLAGLSMGGYVALEIMRQAPDRVLKLCLLDTSARADTDEQQKRRRLLLSMSQAGQFKGVTPRLLPMLISPARLDDKDLTDIIMTMAERVGRDAFHNQQTAILNRIDSRPYLKDIKCPVQLIVGDQDGLTPPEIMREIKDGIPQAKFNVLKDCGHLSALEKPDEVSSLMRGWLRS
ncbi:MAG TPA: alpha/beta fold hydrolase [Alphaproteobacteria bacterium]|nr:alpha/beta fold hydrolase [Alphaproteobacteria bacterium]